jgi:hypothetical protein
MTTTMVVVRARVDHEVMPVALGARVESDVVVLSARVGYVMMVAESVKLKGSSLGMGLLNANPQAMCLHL